jgi:hypothetical protein
METMHGRRAGRVIRAKGTAHTTKDFGLKDFQEVRMLDPKWEKDIHIWFPSGKKSFEDGKPFVFRMLPALSLSVDGEDRVAEFVPGRDPTTGELSVEMIRAVGMIDRFGSGTHQVTFLPHTPYQPDEGYDEYASPSDNPLALIRYGLRAALRTNSLPPEWLPLTFSKTKAEEELKKAGIRNKYTSVLLPLVQPRFLCYVWVYEGYDRYKEKFIRVPDDPIGAQPEHGLQMAVLNEQIFEALAYTYKLKERTRGKITNSFQFPDPANEKEGCLNYAWNKTCVSPIDGNVMPSDGFGYMATASVEYYDKPNRPEDIALSLPPEFGDWYYAHWQWWDDVLKPITGVEQVHLIAEYFPELGPVCQQLWDGHEKLLEAWEKAPFVRKEVNFVDLFYAINRPPTAGTPTRGIKVSDSDGLADDDFEPEGPVTRSSRATRRTNSRLRDLHDDEAEERAALAAQQRRRKFDIGDGYDTDTDDDEVNVEIGEEAAPAAKPKKDVRAAAVDKVRKQGTAGNSRTAVTRQRPASLETHANEFDDSDYDPEEDAAAALGH